MVSRLIKLYCRLQYTITGSATYISGRGKTAVHRPQEKLKEIRDFVTSLR